MTPNDLEILIHYYVNPNTHPRIYADAVKDSISQFLHNGIFEQSEKIASGFKVTEKGRAWMQIILNTPYPRRAWIDDNDKIVMTEETE